MYRQFNKVKTLQYYNPCMGQYFNRINYKQGDINTYLVVQQRNVSFQSQIESLARAQSSIFKTLTESAPVDYCQKFLLKLHEITGLPWWATIICTTIILRGSVTVPLAIYQNYILSKIECVKLEMNDIAEELKKETAIAVKLYNWDEKTARITFRRSIKKQWDNLIIRENCHPFKATLLVFFQIPLWVSLSISLRNLIYMLPNRDINAQVTFLELSNGGFGWIPNLTELDSSLILPLSFGLLNLGIIEIQTLSKSKTPTKIQRYLTNFFRGVIIMMVPVATSVPSCMVLYWTTSSAFGFIQNLVLLSPKVRRVCKIPHTPSELQHPYNHIMTQIRSKYKSTVARCRIS